MPFMGSADSATTVRSTVALGASCATGSVRPWIDASPTAPPWAIDAVSALICTGLSIALASTTRIDPPATAAAARNTSPARSSNRAVNGTTSALSPGTAICTWPRNSDAVSRCMASNSTRKSGSGMVNVSLKPPCRISDAPDRTSRTEPCSVGRSTVNVTSVVKNGCICTLAAPNPGSAASRRDASRSRAVSVYGATR